MKVRVTRLCAAIVVSLLACGEGDNSTKANTGTAPALAPAPASSAVGYSTNFNLIENPISEGGKWINGKAVGLDWNNVQTVPGRAFAANFTGSPNRYSDPIAHLNTAFAANQYAQGTVSRMAGYSPGMGHEIELLLRFEITAHNARGYEVLWAHDGNMAIVRWNGPLANYTPLVDGLKIGRAVDGDVLRAEIVGNVIRVYKNGALVATGPADTTWTGGQPGMGFWPIPGATLQSYGWKNFPGGQPVEAAVPSRRSYGARDILRCDRCQPTQARPPGLRQIS